MKSNLIHRSTAGLAAILYAPFDPEHSARRSGRLLRRGLAVLLSAALTLIPMGQSEIFAQQAPPPAASDQASGQAPAMAQDYDDEAPTPDEIPPEEEQAPPPPDQSQQAPPPGYDQQGPPPPDAQQGPPPDYGEQGPPPAYDQQTGPQAQPLAEEQLDQLVAPIALYPDALVAQVLAASTYPTQVVEANRWLKSQGDLSAEEIAERVDDQPWDASVKALTAFPSVLDRMDHNLQWTTDLGNAYYNQPQDVMDAIQHLRHEAEQAGNLRSTPQMNVTEEGDDIGIAPANPAVVYVPVYDPWSVWGYPLAPYPGFYYYAPPGVFFTAGLPFGFFGVSIGVWSGWGWGWHHWGCGWHNRAVFFNRTTYITRSRTVYNYGFHRPGGPPRSFAGMRGSYALHSGFRGGRDFNRGGVSSRTGSFGRGGFNNRGSSLNRGTAGGFNRGSNRGPATGFNRGDREFNRGGGFNRGSGEFNRGGSGGFNRGNSGGFTRGTPGGFNRGANSRSFSPGTPGAGFNSRPSMNRGSFGGSRPPAGRPTGAMPSGARPNFGGARPSFGGGHVGGGARPSVGGGGARPSFGGGGARPSFGGGGARPSFGGGGGSHGGGGGGGSRGNGGGGGHRGR